MQELMAVKAQMEDNEEEQRRRDAGPYTFPPMKSRAIMKTTVFNGEDAHGDTEQLMFAYLVFPTEEEDKAKIAEAIINTVDNFRFYHKYTVPGTEDLALGLDEVVNPAKSY